MSKKMIKNLMLVIVMAVLCAAMAVTANAESAIVDTGECGAPRNNVTWTLYDDGKLIISGEGKMEDYGSCDDSGSWSYQITLPWEKTEVELTSVEIREGVTKIGNAAFIGSQKLETVSISGSVEEIGEISFAECTSLKSVSIPDGVKKIGQSAFNACRLLTEIRLPDTVSYIGAYAFGYCDSLENVVIGSGVETIGSGAFKNYTSNDINFEYTGSDDEWSDILFYDGNEDLIKDISGEDVVTEIVDGITYRITGNKAILVSCDSDNSGEVIIPDKISGFPVVVIEGRAFADSEITAVSMPDSVLEIGSYAFGFCENLSQVSLSSKIRRLGESSFYGCTNLKGITLPEGIEIIEEQTFSDCENLQAIQFPDSVVEIRASAFSYCKNLQTIQIPDSVIKICDSAFNNCISATELLIGENVVCIGEHSFAGCNSLKSVKIGKELQFIRPGAFVQGYSLEEIYVDENNQYFCVDEAGVLYSKDKEILVLYPNGKPTEKYSVCSTTKKIDVCAFLCTSYLKELYLPDGLEVIGETAFSFSSGLKSITIPESVLLLDKLALYNVIGLEQIYIRSMDAEISEDVFFCERAIKQEHIDFLKDYLKTPNPDEEMNAQFEEIFSSAVVINNPYTIYCHKGSTAEAYAAENGLTYELTHFFNDEWTYDYDNMIRFRKCIHCDELETEPLESTEDGDVEIIAPENPDLNFDVDEFEKGGDNFVLVEEIVNEASDAETEVLKVFDINLKNHDGVHVQPDGSVKVKLPLDWEKDGNYKVYRVNDDGTLTDMQAFRQGSHMVFETDHFSIYVIVEEAPVSEEPPEEEPSTDGCEKGFFDFLIRLVRILEHFFASFFEWLSFCK